MKLKLTEHFRENWRTRVGGEPTVDLVEKIVSEGVRVQPCRTYRLKNGCTHLSLAIYWHPDMDVVVKIDMKKRAAVSVLSAENMPEAPRKVRCPTVHAQGGL